MRLNDGRVVPELCRQGLIGEAFTIHGDGQQTRSFCYVADLVEGIYRLSQSSEHLPVNIGNPGEYTILEFAAAIESVLGKKLEKKFIPGRPDDPRRRRPDIGKAERVLGWKPEVKLEHGLRLTLEAFRQELGL
jgi:dTDP-glucose 4,6-dehydratase